MAYNSRNPRFHEEGDAYSFRRTVKQPNSSSSPEEEIHTHEFESSTKLAEEGEDRHNHRVAGVTTGAIPIPGGHHIHGFQTNTDSVDHFHEIAGTTGPEIILNPQAPVAMQKHVHVMSGNTTEVDGHNHQFLFATLIESPLVPMPS